MADEDLADGAREAAAPLLDLWEPGAPVISRRVYIPRGAPAEMLVSAIKVVTEKVPGRAVKPPSWHQAFPEEQQPQTWS